MAELKLVGIGPGDHDGLTFAAWDALLQADLIVGYTRYIRLLKPMLPGKKFFATGMTHEVERCRTALEMAAAGRSVAMVCSGDAGVYAMAGLVFELAAGFTGIDLKVVPGVTAATSGAAALGAPIGNDFAVISLSDRLTEWPLIARRIEAAAQTDFCIVLYNPSSHGRAGHLARAAEIMLEHKPAETVCGLAHRIGREGEHTQLTTLGELAQAQADMFTTVFIGNTATVVIDGRMVTRRGYRGV